MTELSKSDQRIKRLMEQVGMPNSTSLYQAFKQLETEVLIEASPPTNASSIASEPYDWRRDPTKNFGNGY